MAKAGLKRGASFTLDDAAVLRRQAGEIEVQNRITKVAHCLKKYPLYLPVCERALTEAGADLSLEPVMEEAPAPKKARSAPNLMGKGSVLPKCEVYFGMVSSGNLQHLLGEMEAFFTPENISRLRPTARRAVPKASLQQLVEFLTGMRADSWIGTAGPLKTFDHLAASLAKLNVLRGRRGRDLRLPPTWPVDGVYRAFVSVEGRIGIVHKFLEHKPSSIVSLPDEYLAVVKFPHALVVERNWSEVDALLVEAKGKLRFKLATLFPDLVHENVLSLIGEHPVNNCEALPRPANMEHALTDLLDSEKFTRRPALCPEEASSSTVKGGSYARSDSTETSLWSTADISTNGSLGPMQGTDGAAPLEDGQALASQVEPEQASLEPAPEQEPEQLHQQQQPSAVSQDAIIDESQIPLS